MQIKLIRKLRSLYVGGYYKYTNREEYELFDDSNCSNKVATIYFYPDTKKVVLGDCDLLDLEQVKEVVEFMNNLVEGTK